MPNFSTERDVMDFLWTTGHGPTGFRCRCGCTTGYGRGPLARSKVCKDCGAEISVTANTLMRHTRLPLLAWVEALHPSAGIPTARALARKFDIAVSSAWHLLQRIMRWVEARAVEQTERSEVVRVALRARLTPMTAAAPAHIVALDEAGAADVRLRVEVAGDRAWPGPIGVDPSETAGHPLCSQLADELRRRGGVSLRWLPRWVAALLGEWSHARTARWWEALRTRPIPLRRLDPWLEG